MPLTQVEQVKPMRPGIFLRVDSQLQVTDCCCQGDNFAGIQIRSGSESSLALVPTSLPEINKALRGALEGRPELARYSLNIQERQIHCELHCFPCPDHISSGATCFLLDRTAEENAANRLERKLHILDIISQAIRTFAETRNLSEILRIILLGVTAGPGLAFNRGFVLLSNESRTHLWGCLATGPSTAEEAGTIWQNLARERLTLEETLRLYKAGSNAVGDIQVNRLVSTLKISLADESNFIVKAVKEGRSLITASSHIDGPSNRELVEKFGTDSIAVVPLISHENLQGVLLADNLITRKPISQSDLNVLEIFARYAADAIENSRLYGKLEQQVSRLREANEKIIQSRENLIKAEKLSSVAKMALEVAHEIRNPLTVIGGYANSHLKKLGPEHDSFKVLEIVTRQVSRIESALDRFSSVVTLSEKKEGRFNLAYLLKEAMGMLFGGIHQEIPLLEIEQNAQDMHVVVDQGLFNQAMMATLRKASQITGGMQGLKLKAARNGRCGMIFIMGADNHPKFAEDFYRLFRESKRDLSNQDIAVALEILQHYGGGIGVSSGEKNEMQVYIELPLCGEE
jgi:GAF domain-containing protein